MPGRLSYIIANFGERIVTEPVAVMDYHRNVFYALVVMIPHHCPLDSVRVLSPYEKALIRCLFRSQ
jgi:hypothetical protein